MQEKVKDRTPNKNATNVSQLPGSAWSGKTHRASLLCVPPVLSAIVSRDASPWQRAGPGLACLILPGLSEPTYLDLDTVHLALDLLAILVAPGPRPPFSQSALRGPGTALLPVVVCEEQAAGLGRPQALDRQEVGRARAKLGGLSLEPAIDQIKSRVCIKASVQAYEPD